jgi:hypothetical protein
MAPVRASRSNVGSAPIDGAAESAGAWLAASDGGADGASTLGAAEASVLAAGADEAALPPQAAARSPVATTRAVIRVR